MIILFNNQPLCTALFCGLYQSRKILFSFAQCQQIYAVFSAPKILYMYQRAASAVFL